MWLRVNLDIKKRRADILELAKKPRRLGKKLGAWPVKKTRSMDMWSQLKKRFYILNSIAKATINLGSGTYYAYFDEESYTVTIYEVAEE